MLWTSWHSLSLIVVAVAVDVGPPAAARLVAT